MTVNAGTVIDPGGQSPAWWCAPGSDRDVPNARWIALRVLPAPLF